MINKTKSICYLLRETTTNNYKIGTSINVLGRFHNHCSSNINLELVGITYKREGDLHDEFKEFRLQREWFNLCKCEKSKKRLLSYFIEFSETNLKQVYNKLGINSPSRKKPLVVLGEPIEPPKKKRPMRRIGDPKPEKVQTKKIEPVIRHTSYDDTPTTKSSQNCNSKHAYHMMMKYGGRRW